MKKLTKKSLDELAIEMPLISEIEQKSFVGRGDGSLLDPFTLSEFNWMMASGLFQGGYVENYNGSGSTYIDKPEEISGALFDFSQPGYHTTLEEYTQSYGSGYTQFMTKLIGYVPYVGTYLEHLGNQVKSMHEDMRTQIKDHYGLGTKVYVSMVEKNNQYVYTVYNAETGQPLETRIMSISGYYYEP